MKRKLLLRTMLLLCALIVGSMSVWAADEETVFKETFGTSNTKAADYSSYTGFTATSTMFTSGTANSNYTGSGSVAKVSSIVSDYEGASGGVNVLHTGTANTEATILSIANIKISDYTDLTLSFGMYLGGAAKYVSAYYSIDGGSEQELTLSDYTAKGSTWFHVSASIPSTGNSLTLTFKHKPTKAWGTRLDDIVVTGTKADTGGDTKTPKPTITGAQGESFTFNQNITIGGVDDATYYYTTDESAPEATDAYKYTAPFNITGTTTVKAIAVVDGKEASDIQEVKFTKTLATPTFAFGTPSVSLNIGDTFTLDASTDDSDGIITYRSADESIASVSGSVVTGVAKGTTTVTATLAATDDYAEAKATCTVKVIDPDADDVTFDFANNQYGLGVSTNSSTAGDVADGKVFEQDGVTMTFSQNTTKTQTRFWGTNVQLRIYEGSSFTLAAPEGKAITEVAFVGTVNLKVGEDAVSNKSWSGFAKTVTFTNSSSASQLTSVTVTLAPASVTITPAYAKTTYVTTKKLDFTGVEGLKAYVATKATKAGVTMKVVETAVPEGTPLLLVGTAETAYQVPVADAATAPETNLLKAGDGTTVFDGTTYDYILYSDGLFYQIGSGTVATNKAYLHLESAPAANGLSIIFEDDMTTGVQNVEHGMLNVESFYNLNGQRVAQPTKGLYIVNGKKVIIK